MELSAPTQIVFIIAVVIAILGLIAQFTAILAFLPIGAFWYMTVAFVILAAGCLLKGM